MHIFIDESGNFTLTAPRHRISAVGALTIPDAILGSLEKKYAKIRSDLPMENGEVKGRSLSENQIAGVASLLARHQVLFAITISDTALHRPADLAVHQKAQAEKFTHRLTPAHHSTLHTAMWDFRKRLAQMTPQLYLQSIVTFDLIERVLQQNTLFYSQRSPKELAAFHWVIDGKDRNRTTDWEQWWSYVVRPTLQSRSLRKPMIFLTEADYLHFARFITKIGDHLKPFLTKRNDKDDAIDLNLVMTESFQFSSNATPGLELIDILVNATRRALMGHLKIEGWRDIPRLMIHTRPQYIKVLASYRIPLRQFPYLSVLKHFSQGGKNIFAPRFRREIDDPKFRDFALPLEIH